MSKETLELIFDDPDGRGGGVPITGMWTHEVEKRAKGTVHFTHYYGMDPAITKIADVIRDVPAKGGHYHLLDIIQTPLIFPNSIVGSKVVAQLYAEFQELRNELSDVKVVGLGIGGLMAIFSTKAWGPIRTLEDLEGAKIRSMLVIDEFIQTLGAKPMHVSFLEIGHLLETGELDATVIGINPARRLKLAEKAAPYCTIVGNRSITMHPMRLSMKWDKWNSLPSDVQRIMDELGPGGSDCWFAVHNGSSMDSHLVGALEYVGKTGGKIIRLAPAEVERWIKIREPIRDRVVNVAEGMGLPGKRFFKRMLELVEGYSRILLSEV